MEHQMTDYIDAVRFASSEVPSPRDDIRVRSFHFMNDAIFNAAVLGGLQNILSESIKDVNNDETKELLEEAIGHIGDAIRAVNKAIIANNKELAKIKPGDIPNA